MLDIPRDVASALGQSAVLAGRTGSYRTRSGKTIDWSDAVANARSVKKSIPPDKTLPEPPRRAVTTDVIVANKSTLETSRELVEQGARLLALNFANGIHPGGGFLNGARAQEEVLCRSSALFETLLGDPMYETHMRRPEPDSTDWAILSPDVPVFRNDAGEELDEPWVLSVVTCAAPVATRIGQPKSGDLLEKRIHRVLSIAEAFEYDSLVLGAWGCGAFGNDPLRTAKDFRRALETQFAGAFATVIFAITDWSQERRYLSPFIDTFSAETGIQLQ
jgi:uncharacterized protein (TIGR02452 family)